MRDPAPRVDSKVEAVIEDTRRFLEGYVQSESWKTDADGYACDLRATMGEIAESNMPDWAKNFAILVLFEQTKKRRKKPTRPTRHYRNMALELAAARLVMQGYKPTRNDETRHRESASSIICKALELLDVEIILEKQINAIVRGASDTARHFALIRDEFGCDVLK
jgi:hypothetical protein